MGDVSLKYEKHAIHKGQPGSWFRPQQWWVKGYKIFYPDTAICKAKQIFAGADPAYRINDKENGCFIPVGEMLKADRARLDYLLHRSAVEDRKIKSEDLKNDHDLFRFQGEIVESANGMMARFRCGERKLDYNRDDLKSLLVCEANSFSEMLAAPPARPGFSEKDIIRALGILSGSMSYRTIKGPPLKLLFHYYAADEGMIEFQSCDKRRSVTVSVSENDLRERLKENLNHVLPGASISKKELLEALSIVEMHSRVSAPHPG